ncbi:MAG: DNA translocase FtsK 4TM domain-containing protein, partial [Planctomycetes bacterium]|nr:DNA translocase FtsK 4TM domain-containing protein [Planctomycetota bacterium]
MKRGKKKTTQTDNRSQVNRIAMVSVGMGLCLFVLISLMSFDTSEWPNPDVASAEGIRNLCGPVGAFLSYYCVYYLGPASYAILAFLLFWLIRRCMDEPIDQPILRTIGLLLISAAWSGGTYIINHGSEASLSMGNGGVLGIAVGHTLLTHTALTGTVLIIGAGALVGLLLAADSVMLGAGQFFFTGARWVGGWAGQAQGVRKNRTSSRTKTKRRWSLFDLDKIRLAFGRKNQTWTPSDNLDEEEEYQDEEEEDQTDSSDSPASQRTLAAVSSAIAKIHRRSAGPSKTSQETQMYDEYEYPSLDLLDNPERGYASLQEKVVREKGRILAKTLREFNIDAPVVAVESGPVITMFELELAPGIKVAQISNLSNDLARSLGVQTVRVVAPLPGRHTIG